MDTLNLIVLSSIVWWVAGLLAGAVVWPRLVRRFGHHLGTEFLTMGVITVVVAIGVVFTEVVMLP